MTTANTTPTVVPGSPEHNSAMIALAEGRAAPHVASVEDTQNIQPAEGVVKPDAAAVTTHEKPEGVPDKFFDAKTGVVDYKAWGQSTAELERSFTQSRQQKPAPAAPDTKLADAVKAAETALAAATDDAAKAAAQTELDAAKAAVTAAAAAPVNVTEVLAKAHEEYSKDQQLTDETYKALQKAGYAKEYVDRYVEGEAARAELYTLKVQTEVGGAAEYTKLTGWAGTNYTEAQQTVFDEAVASGDLTKALAAVQSLKQAYVAANGQAPATRVEGHGPSGSTPAAYFKSGAEQTAAMQDPRYRTDPAYRNEVAQKIAGSVQLGIHLGVHGR